MTNIFELFIRMKLVNRVHDNICPFTVGYWPSQLFYSNYEENMQNVHDVVNVWIVHYLLEDI